MVVSFCSELCVCACMCMLEYTCEACSACCSVFLQRLCEAVRTSGNVVEWEQHYVTQQPRLWLTHVKEGCATGGAAISMVSRRTTGKQEMQSIKSRSTWLSLHHQCFSLLFSFRSLVHYVSDWFTSSSSCAFLPAPKGVTGIVFGLVC